MPSNQWLAVFELMLKARDTSKQPSAATKNRALYAYAKTGKWELALVLATNMQERGEADHETYGCSLAACDVGGQWERALDIFNNVQQMSLRPTALIYCGAIRSYDMLGKRQKALELYSQMGALSLRK
eukprot:jgi/Bigna1/80529/fgenesh1_pg.72_\